MRGDSYIYLYLYLTCCENIFTQECNIAIETFLEQSIERRCRCTHLTELERTGPIRISYLCMYHEIVYRKTFLTFEIQYFVRDKDINVIKL